MRQGFFLIAICLCVAAFAGPARADLSATESLCFQPDGQAPPAVSEASPATAIDADSPLALLTDLRAGSLRDVASSASPADRPSAVITNDGASSLSLLLSALGSMGAWQLVRSSRKVHLAQVPDWFHTGAPFRIGRSTVVDINGAGIVAFTIAPHDTPRPPVRLPAQRAQDRPALLSLQSFLTVADTRGPPPTSL